MTGWSSTVSAGMVTLKIRLAACHTRAARRELGTNPLAPRSPLSTVSWSTATPSGAWASAWTVSAERSASWCRPRIRLSGVNRQISSRPVGTAWSSTSKEPSGWRWEETLAVSIASATAGVSVTVTTSAF